MKKLLAIAATVAAVAMAGSAMAATTGNLNVSATVTDSCSITGGTLAFGTLNAVTAPVVNAGSAGVSVTCTNLTSYHVTAGNGQHYASGVYHLDDGTGNEIAYTFTSAFPIAGTGNGASQTIAINGQIAAGSYTGAPAGAYSDQVVLTVGP